MRRTIGLLAAGCYRPHVVRDERTGRYVLWINGYDNESNYLVLTDIRAGHRLKIERLGPRHTSGTGDVVDLGVSGVEAPAMFRRGDRYHVAYSDPAAGAR